MIMNRNQIYTNHIHNYMLQPGDGTCYRFSMQEIPECDEGYVIESGAGTGDYFMVYINMPGGSGVGCVMGYHLSCFPEQLHQIGYWMSHGFGNVNLYTLVAVMLAITVLRCNPEAITEAAENMLLAREVLARMKAEHYDDSDE
jgi:hypothetical protein